MNEELGQFDAQLRGLFVELKFDEVRDLLKEQPDVAVIELSETNWNIIKKYYDTERFDLLFTHIKYVAYTSFLVEYAYQAGLISDETFNMRMVVYNSIYDLMKQQG